MDGPYFEDAVPYSESGGDDRTLTQYLSVGWLRTVAAAPGSPIVVLSRVEVDERDTEFALLAARVAELAEEVDRLEQERQALLARLGEVPAGGPVDVEALTNTLVAHLDGRYQRKTGRKPKAAA